MKERESIIIIEGGRIGDAICHTPSFSLLRHYKPNAQIDMIVDNAVTAEIYQNNPDIDHIYIAPSKAKTKTLANKYNYALAMKPAKEDVLKYSDWLKIKTFYCRGYNKHHLSCAALIFISSVLNLKNYDGFPLHYRLYPQAAQQNRAIELLKNNGATLTDKEILVGVHIGCYKVAKRSLQLYKHKIASHRTWPLYNYRTLANRLFAANPNIKIVLTGTEGENRIAHKTFKNTERIIYLGGKTSVLELAAVMKYFKVFLSGDTGPMHLAIATNIPLISLFGATDPKLSGPKPIKPHHTIINRNSISDITVDEVYDTVLKYFEE